MAITDGNSNELVMPVQPLGGGYGNNGFFGGKSVDDVIPIIDDIMTALQRINPRLYNLAISKL